MTFFRRFVSLTFIVGCFITFFYLFAIWHTFPPYSGRTLIGRLFGVLSLMATLGTSFSYRWQRKRVPLKEQQTRWHIHLGLLSVWVILLHAHFRFGNGVAVLTLASLIGVALSGAAIALCDQRLTTLDTESPGSDNIRAIQLRYTTLREQWCILHVAATAGFLTFVAIHILSVFYY